MTSRHQPNMVMMMIRRPGITYQRCGVPAFFEMKNMIRPTASESAPTAPPHVHDPRLSGAVEGIGQSDLGDVLGILVVDDLGIDEEGDRHLDARAGGKPLLLEAEALDLGEVAPGKLGHHVEDGGACDRSVRIIGGLEEDKRRLADLDLDYALDRAEGPRQGMIDIGVEADADGAIENLVGRALGTLRHAAIAGRLAE